MEKENMNFDVISYCGLYCENCNKFKNDKCPGCKKNEKASWCKIRQCGIENKYNSCAECKDPGTVDCKKFNNRIGKVFAFIFNSDREAGIQLIKDEGYEGFKIYMEENKKMTIPRRRKDNVLELNR
ncbi:MAG: DUF3795 domain-containing protein [Salinivirgaceae bacterium]|nr:DUF3795 domain-containing protein [Salinivirgaceae bacterium]